MRKSSVLNLLFVAVNKAEKRRTQWQTKSFVFNLSILTFWKLSPLGERSKLCRRANEKIFFATNFTSRSLKPSGKYWRLRAYDQCVVAQHKLRFATINHRALNSFVQFFTIPRKLSFVFVALSFFLIKRKAPKENLFSCNKSPVRISMNKSAELKSKLFPSAPVRFHSFPSLRSPRLSTVPR